VEETESTKITAERRKALGVELQGARVGVLGLIKQNLSYAWQVEGQHARAAAALKCKGFSVLKPDHACDPIACLYSTFVPVNAVNYAVYTEGIASWTRAAF
jgi:hypothetical protein